MALGDLALRWVAQVGPACRHDVLARAARPSSPGADQAGEDAADALADAVLDALLGWWSSHVLPRRCPAAHAVEHLADGDGASLDDAADQVLAALDPPGLRWVDLPLAVDASGRLVVGDGPTVRACLLAADRLEDADVRDL